MSSLASLEVQREQRTVLTVTEPSSEASPAGAGLVGTLSILLLAAVLRVPGFGRIFEQDELYTVQEATELFRTTLKPGIDSRPLYYLIQHVLLKVGPATEFSLRLLPFVFGLLGVLATLLVARRLFGRTAGVAAGFMVAVAPWHLHISGMARYWSLVYLLGVLAVGALARSLTSGRGRDHALTVAVLLAGIATHPTFLFPALGIVAGAHVVRSDGRFGLAWPTRPQWLQLYLPLAAALVLAWLALQLTGKEGSLQNWGGRGMLASLRLLPAIVEWAVPAVCAAAGIGVVLLLAQRSDAAARRWGALLAGGMIASLGGLTASSLRTSVYADYATAALPLVFLGTGALVELGARRLRAPAWILAFASLSVLGAAVAPSTVSHLSDGMRYDYRPAYEHIRRTAPDVAVITWPLVLQRHYAPDLRGIGLKVRASFLEEERNQRGDVWVVASMARFGMVEDDDRSVEGWLRQNCDLEHSYGRPRFDYRSYTVNLFRCRSAQ